MKPIIVPGSEEKIAILAVGQGATNRLVAILATLVFWQTISFLLIALVCLGVIPRTIFHEYISNIALVLSIFGVSPFLLSVLSWRTSEKLLCRFLSYYQSQHLKDS